ncbi:MAG: AIPR family protein [Promethearchaeota archaeon]
MPEGNRRTPVDIELPFYAYSENNVEGYHIYTFYIKGDNYLELPLDANVRLPSEKSIPYKDMTETLEKSPENFFLQNSGISVIAGKVTPDKNKSKVMFHFPAETGIVNGGHTQLAILKTKDTRDISKAIIKLEVLEHNFNAQELAIIAASKNTASNVKPYSTAEKRGLFVKIKHAMLDKFEKHIVWYENREVPNDKGFPAMDLIALINLFNIEDNQSHHNNTSNSQPNKSATSKASVFKDWESSQTNFEHVYPLINDIINLQEHILSTFDKGIKKGFTTLSVIKNIKDKNRTTTFNSKKMRFELPKQFLLPILASLRAAVKYDEASGKIGWFEKPEDVFDRCKQTLISDLSKTYKTTYHNEINRASKDSSLWRILYLDIEKIVDTNKEWKIYDVPQ